MFRLFLVSLFVACTPLLALGQYELTEGEHAALQLVGQQSERPDDSKHFWLAIFASESDAQKVRSAFERDPRLLELAKQCRTITIDDSGRIYGLKYRDYHPVVPSIVLQDPTGRVVYKVEGDFPANMADEISAALDRYESTIGQLDRDGFRVPNLRIPEVRPQPEDAITEIGRLFRNHGGTLILVVLAVLGIAAYVLGKQ